MLAADDRTARAIASDGPDRRMLDFDVQRSRLTCGSNSAACGATKRDIASCVQLRLPATGQKAGAWLGSGRIACVAYVVQEELEAAVRELDLTRDQSSTGR